MTEAGSRSGQVSSTDGLEPSVDDIAGVIDRRLGARQPRPATDMTPAPAAASTPRPARPVARSLARSVARRVLPGRLLSRLRTLSALGAQVLQRLERVEVAQRAQQADLRAAGRELQHIRDLAANDRLRADRLNSLAPIAESVEAFCHQVGWTETGVPLGERFGTGLHKTEQRILRAEAAVQALSAEMLAQNRRLNLILEQLRRSADARAPVSAETVNALQDEVLDPLYVAFEDRFRGSRSSIIERQRAHLPLLHQAGAGTRDRPVIDVGAGRGEWLQLIRDEGLHGRGVDLNSKMATLCAERGLDCTQGDVIAFLRGLAPDSAGAVTGFHIAEHLPFKVLVALIDEALRVLRPGGVLLLETPNPQNLLVGSHTFYLDPTHRNPLPPGLLSFLAEERGFVRVETRGLHPIDQNFPGYDHALTAELDRFFYGPADYALVAWKA